MTALGTIQGFVDSEEDLRKRKAHLAFLTGKWAYVVGSQEDETLQQCFALFCEEVQNIFLRDAKTTHLLTPGLFPCVRTLMTEREESDPGWASMYVEDFLTTGVFNKVSFACDLECMAARSTELLKVLTEET